jgi:hypothetical protein
MATSNLGFQNKFSTTLTSGIVSTDTTIALNTLPTPTEGYLILEPDSSTAWEEIYYTSKTGSAVVCPSVGAGRGVGGSTAASHSQGATVRMDSSAEMFIALQKGSALTPLTNTFSNLYKFNVATTASTMTGNTIIPMNSKTGGRLLDTSGNFNISTYLFTAPVAGFYQFNGTVNFLGVSTYSFTTSLVINGTADGIGSQAQNVTGTYYGQVINRFIPLAANDTVGLFLGSTYSGTVTLSGTQSNLAGYLVCLI